MGDVNRHEVLEMPSRRLFGARPLLLALLSVLLLAVGVGAAPSTALAADAVYIDSPADGTIFQSAPADYLGRAVPESFPPPSDYQPQISGAVQVETSPGVWGGPFCSDIPDVCGVYTFDVALPGPGDTWAASDANPLDVQGSNALADGAYRLRVGQASDVSLPTFYDEIDFFVDGTNPNTTIPIGPSLYNDDSGVTFHFEFGGSDPLVNDYASGIDYFNCKLNGGPWQQCTSPGGSPPYSHDLNVPEGGHTLYATAVDHAGNEDATPAQRYWIVDETPPDITITKPVNKDRYLLHEGPNPIFNCTDPLAGSPAAASGIASCTATPINDEDLGPHFFEVTAVDRAGNVSKKKVAYTIDPPDYGEFVKESHPLAYYRFDEALGSDVMVDSSGNHRNGVYQNGIALRRDSATVCERRPHPPRVCELDHPAENKAAYFPPRDGHGYVNGIAAPKTAYTMEAWVKPRGGADMMVMSHGGGGQLFIKDGKLAFRQVQDTIFSNAAVLPGVWSHVAATWNGSVTRLYVNGLQVASSNSANKAPSGISTLYIGYGEMAPWFHGEMDEAAYYSTAVSQHRLFDRWKIGVAKDNPSLERGNSPFNTEGPNTDPEEPKNGGLYAPTKTPNADFSCFDPDDLPGDSDVASCTATVDGNPIVNGAPLPDNLGVHNFVVTVVDKGGNQYIHTHTYTVKNFAGIFNTDSPVAYYRLGDPAGLFMNDASGNNRNGEYKNDQDSGPVGISGDGDRARNFFGKGGYGFVNGIPAPRFQSTMEAWVNPTDGRDQSIVGHGDAGEIYIDDGHFKFRRMFETVTSSVPVQVGAWQQVVGTWDGADIRIYVNGIETGKTESTRRPSSISTFYVGFGELAPWFYGAIDEVAYYSVALNANRVYQHWLADPPPEDLTVSTSETTEPGNPGEETDPPVTEDPDTPVSDDPAETEDPGTGDDDEVVPISAESGSAGPEISRVSANRKAIKVLIKCSGGQDCSGKLTGTLKLGKKKFAISAGVSAPKNGSAVTTVKLTKAQKKAAKKAKFINVKVTLRSADGTVLDRG